MSDPGDAPDILQSLEELAKLMAEYRQLAMPYDSRIKALDIEKADATAAVKFAIDNLQALLRPLIMDEKRTYRANGLTASYCAKDAWDGAGLRQFGEEVPAVLQFVRDASYVTFRYTGR
jgi:hypothetical protein